MFLIFFFFNDTATTEIYTLSLHDALPIYTEIVMLLLDKTQAQIGDTINYAVIFRQPQGRTPSESLSAERSEEHTSELQSHSDLVCRLLLEKKKKNQLKTSQ